MRTSNKILIAVLVFVFATFTVIYGMLRSKYNKGEYITRDAYDADRSELIKTGSFSSIELINCAGVFMQRSDSFSIRINKNHSRNFTYRVDGNRLIVEGRGDDPGRMVYAQVRIQVPSLNAISLKNAELYLNEFAISTPTAEISNESFLVISTSRIDSFVVSAKDNSTLEMGEGTDVSLLGLSLDGQSRFRSESARIRKFRTIYISDSSSLEMDGKIFKALADTAGRK